MKIVIVGGGWSGCAAALTAVKKGAEVVLLERTDMLLGTGLVGGIFRNNGRFTAAEEAIAMGGGELFQVMDANALHAGVEFPGHAHSSLYSVARIEPAVRRLLLERGVSPLFRSRVIDVEMEGRRITAVIVKSGDEQARIEGDVFVDTTGSAGPPANCNKHGNGCAMCILRCHSFGGRVSLSAKAGVKEYAARKGERVGAMSGSCKLLKDSLDQALVDELNRKGVAVVPLPPKVIMRGKLAIKCCQQYALPEFEENLVLLDTGHAKLMTPFFPLEILRLVPGLENARYEDPYAGGLGNSIRFCAMAPRDDALKVEEVDNLFCAGEKAGPLVGHTEAICTGTLAGHNAACHVRGDPLLIIPDGLALGDIICFARRQVATEEGVSLKYTFSGSVYFRRMAERGLYLTDAGAIAKRVAAFGLKGVFNKN
jgi:hypothetical protein